MTTRLPAWLRCGAKKEAREITREGDASGAFENGLYRFHGIHRGKRCFVVGNGPSLNRINMGLLKDEITLGSNRVYLGFRKWGYHFTYWGIEDFLQIRQGRREFSRALPKRMVKFIPRQYCAWFRTKNICPVNFIYEYEDFPRFSGSPSVLYLGYSVTYMLLQIAVVMGCNPIYLVGVDYHYDIGNGEKVDGGWSDHRSRSHFTPDYCDADRGRVWNLPHFEKTDAAYACAAEWARAHGVEIFNATPGSKLGFFPKVEYGTLFQ